MLKDADPRSFKAIYVVCGRTDMRLGIDSLAAIIETKYHLPIFVPGTLFLFCGKRPNKIKGLIWEGLSEAFCYPHIFLNHNRIIAEGARDWQKRCG